MKEPSPAFQFYPKDFLTSIGQASMSLAEAGAYIRLLSHCWLEGSIPDDPVACARLVATTDKQMQKMWPILAARFYLDNGVLRHRRLDVERQKQERYRELQRAKGKASARARKQPRLNRGSRPVATGAQPTGNSSSPISDLQSPSPEEIQESVATLPPACVPPERIHAAHAHAKANGIQNGIVRRELVATIADVQAGFEEFWAHWPKHEEKQDAKKVWFHLKPSVTLKDIIVAAVDVQKQTPGWLKQGGQFIPGPGKWLRGHRWEDEVQTMPFVTERTANLIKAGKEFLEYDS